MTATAEPVAPLPDHPNHRSSAGNAAARPHRHDRRRKPTKHRRPPADPATLDPAYAPLQPAGGVRHRRLTDRRSFDPPTAAPKSP